GLTMGVSRDGRVAVATLGPGDGGALAFHLDRSGRPVRLGPHNDARGVAVSPDGRYAATLSHGPHGVKVWDSHTGKELASLFPGNKKWGVLFTPDGRWLVVDGQWFEAGTWRREAGLAGRAALCTSGDGKLLASGGDLMRLTDRESGRWLARL